MAASDKDTAKFWGIILMCGVCIMIAVLFIDISIKAAILDESNVLRLLIEGERNDRAAETNHSRNNHKPNSSGGILDIVSTGMETGDVSTRNQASNGASPKTRRTNPKPRTQGNPGEIPEGN